MVVIYDDRCGFCQRSVALIRWLDRGGRFRYEGSSNLKALEEAGLTSAEADDELKVFIAGTVYGGYDGIVEALGQLPAASWAVPVLKHGLVRRAGRRIYRYIAARRKCRTATCPR